MMKSIYKILKYLFLTFLIYVFLSNPNLIITNVNYSIKIFVSNVLPSMLPFFILTDILINYNYIYFLNTIFKFKYSFIIFIALFSGLPSNAKIINTLLDKNMISEKDAGVMLSCTFFPNPMFVIGSVGLLMFNSYKIGISLLLINYLANFIMYLLSYNKLENNHYTAINKSESFLKLIKTSILNNTSILLVILGNIVIFVTLSEIIFNYINIFSIVEYIIRCLFEVTSGIKKVSESLLTLPIKFIIVSSSLAFSSLSILFQAFSILSTHKIDIKLILKRKILIVFITIIIDYLYIIFFM